MAGVVGVVGVVDMARLLHRLWDGMYLGPAVIELQFSCGIITVMNI